MKRVSTKIITAISAIFSLVVFGLIVFHFLEPTWSWVDCFYYSVVTLSTVGFGDLYPTNDASKIFTSFYILFGAATFLASFAIIGSILLKNREKEVIDRIMHKEKASHKTMKDI